VHSFGVIPRSSARHRFPTALLLQPEGNRSEPFFFDGLDMASALLLPLAVSRKNRSRTRSFAFAICRKRVHAHASSITRRGPRGRQSQCLANSYAAFSFEDGRKRDLKVDACIVCGRKLQQAENWIRCHLWGGFASFHWQCFDEYLRADSEHLVENVVWRASTKANART